MAMITLKNLLKCMEYCIETRPELFCGDIDIPPRSDFVIVYDEPSGPLGVWNEETINNTIRQSLEDVRCLQLDTGERTIEISFFQNGAVREIAL